MSTSQQSEMSGRLTDPRVLSYGSSFYQRSISHDNAFALFRSNRSGLMNIFRVDLPSGRSSIGASRRKGRDLSMHCIWLIFLREQYTQFQMSGCMGLKSD